LRGRNGVNGKCGPKGFAGEPGKRGVQGPDGYQGERGAYGQKGDSPSQEEKDALREANRGARGRIGNPGPRGNRGPCGLTGQRGSPGNPGNQGSRGIAGSTGIKGGPGARGDAGVQGPQGQPGIRGEDGLDGEVGAVGERGLTQTIGFTFARHGQSMEKQSCPKGTIKLWDGYSLLHTVGNQYHHGQDLGRVGSCVKRFNTMPSSHCNRDSTCSRASRNGKSYWLTTSAAIPTMAIDVNQAEMYISKCAACEAPGTIFALHSQTMETPECPANYNALWLGYSFLQHTSDGNGGGGQDLMSPGSCLEDFRATPFIECTGARGTCQYFANSLSFWMRTIEPSNEFQDPQLQAFKGRLNGRNQVSRCAVCTRDI
jgi:integrin beta 8